MRRKEKKLHILLAKPSSKRKQLVFICSYPMRRQGKQASHTSCEAFFISIQKPTRDTKNVHVSLGSIPSRKGHYQDCFPLGNHKNPSVYLQALT